MLARVGGELVQHQRQLHRDPRIEHHLGPGNRDRVRRALAEQHLLADERVRVAPCIPADQQVVGPGQRLDPPVEGGNESLGAGGAAHRLAGDRLDGRQRVLDPMIELVEEQRGSSSLRLRSVTSRATFEAPTMLPLLSRIGEMVSEMSIRRPSFAIRTVSKCSMRRPGRSSARISSSSCCRSAGMIC